MSGWRIAPAVVGDVIERVREHGADLDAALAPWQIEGVNDDLTRAGPVAVDVQAALTLLLDAQADRVATIGNRVSAGVVGVESAAACYDTGQIEMAGNCQDQMLHSADTGDFTWWEADG